MQCFIYKSAKKEELYLYIGKKDDFSAVPEDLLKNLGKLVFVMELELTSQLKLARENASNVIQNIASKGFFVQMPPPLTTLSLGNHNRQLH